MNAAAYIRVSTGRQAEEGTSLDNQRFSIKSYAALDSIEDIDFFVEEGVSGRDIKNRPQLNSLLAKIESGAYNRLYIYSLSRLGRNTHDTLSIVSFLKHKGVVLISYTEKWDTSTAIGQFGLELLASLAAFESNQISERVRAVANYNKSNGLRYSGPVYGFDQTDKKLVPLAKEANTVRLIFKLRDNKKSMLRIAETLNNEVGATTKQGHKWRQNSVRRVLEKEQLYRSEGILT